MSNLPISSKYRSLPDQPVTEAEREDLARRLNEGFSRGTIDQDDYSRLLDVVFAAKTNGDLLPVAEVLPVKQTYDQPAIVAQSGTAGPGELAPTRSANTLALWAVAGGGALALLVVALLLLVLL